MDRMTDFLKTASPVALVAAIALYSISVIKDMSKK